MQGWFATHPLEEERIQNTRNAIAQLPGSTSGLATNTQAFQTFQQRLRQLPPARRRVLVDVEESDGTREVRRWTLCDESIAALLPFLARGVLHHAPAPDGWLDDLAVYRDGELLLGIVSHEREGVLRLRDDEHAAVAALGVRSDETDGSLTRFAR